MTTTTTDWRGVAVEKKDDLPDQAGLRLRAQSRQLLGQLVRPHRKELLFCAGMVLVQTAFNMAGPYLVAVGIDRGIPAVRRGDAGPIVAVFVAMLVSAGIASAPRALFLNQVRRIRPALPLNPRPLGVTQVHAPPPGLHPHY